MTTEPTEPTEVKPRKYASEVENILRDTTQSQVTAFVAYQAPTEDLAERARVKMPHAFHVSSNAAEEWVYHNLTRLAIRNAFDDLARIRREKLHTHMEGHAAAYLFKKTVEMYRLHLLYGGSNHVETGFEHYVDSLCGDVTDAFGPLFDVLKADIQVYVLREKDVLVRAFWQKFAAVFERFWEEDPYELAIELYVEALARLPSDTLASIQGEGT